jgi:hypothetical protein
MNKIYIALGAVIAAGVIFLCGVQLASTYKPSYGNIQGQNGTFYSVGTSTSEVVTSTSGTVLATSTGRTWARIANTSSSSITCIYNNGAPATVANGFIINASSTFSMNGLSEPVYTGGVQCISDNGATEKIYVEANQQ